MKFGDKARLCNSYVGRDEGEGKERERTDRENWSKFALVLVCGLDLGLCVGWLDGCGVAVCVREGIWIWCAAVLWRRCDWGYSWVDVSVSLLQVLQVLPMRGLIEDGASRERLGKACVCGLGVVF